MAHHMQYPDLQVVVLAAGKGTRMKSSRSKVLHSLLGIAMLEHVLHAVEQLHPKSIAVVTGHDGDTVRSYIGEIPNLQWVAQEQQLGTGHAVLQCERVIGDAEHVLIVCGDTPLLRPETLDSLVQTHQTNASDVTVLTAHFGHPHGYGRIVRDKSGNIVSIVEEKDASEEQRQIKEVSSGIFCVKARELFRLLAKVENSNTQGEYYLPDIVPLALEAGLSVHSGTVGDVHEIQGINDRAQLAFAEKCMQQRIIRDWQMQGVSIENPETVRIESKVRIGNDTLIKAGSQLYGSTQIGDDCVIGPYAVLEDAWLDDGVEVFAFSHIQGANAGSGSKIGPFARLRPGAELDEQVHIGNFVEIKKSVIGRGSKINHLSYIGDASMGNGCNIGAGTITCNYDGANKHRTVIGDRVFVGSDTKLVAPIEVGSDATIGAGSIITRRVSEGGLTLSARPDQRHLPNWQRPTKKPTEKPTEKD